ncbi:MAG: excinuclease ABC subunit UvrC [Pseudomonadota bacterium]|nr:excinuclease ABC subunit UvrC [Pseudomonadota bacterium]
MRFAELIAHLESKPGIYMMLSDKSVPLYIGKAKDLKKRLKQYFQNKPSSYRIEVMLTLVHDIKVIITDSESEALVLENRLIKEHQPKYNILLKDGKSFPYLAFSKHAFPRLMMKRNRGKGEAKMYGPYTNQKQARDVLDQVQRVFQIRNCSDHFYRNRTRPCIQHEIARCTAPCVGLVSEQDYAKDVSDARMLLKGEVGHVSQRISKKMYEFADQEAFEQAAACRDLLRHLAVGASEVKTGHMHVFDTAVMGNQVIVLRLDVVDGHVTDANCELVEIEGKHVEQDWLIQYVYHFYQLFSTPKTIVLPISDPSLLQNALCNKRVQVKDLHSAAFKDLKVVAQDNISAYKTAQSNELYQWPQFWGQLEQYLNQSISKIICVDVSHHQGSSTYCAFVVCNAHGMDKSKYRTTKIEANRDDCYAIREGLARKMKAGVIDESTLLVIDGGKGQINAAIKAVADSRAVITSVSKGPGREWGKEKFYRYDGEVNLFKWPYELIKYILHIRDEAHNLAITTHRRALRKLSLQSVLDQVWGVGSDKRKKILEHFGGLEQLQCAKISDIERVPGVGKALAKRIYDTLHMK